MAQGGDMRLDIEGLLHPDEQLRFRRLCIDTPRAEFGPLAENVSFHLTQVKDRAVPATDVETAEQVARALLVLLNEPDEFGPDDRALIRGATEYFVLDDDASGDINNVLGFDDDARILNSVLDRLNRLDLRVDLPA